eukprot:3714013-Rhodomonas_salina.2
MTAVISISPLSSLSAPGGASLATLYPAWQQYPRMTCAGSSHRQVLRHCFSPAAVQWKRSFQCLHRNALSQPNAASMGFLCNQCQATWEWDEGDRRKGAWEGRRTGLKDRAHSPLWQVAREVDEHSAAALNQLLHSSIPMLAHVVAQNHRVLLPSSIVSQHWAQLVACKTPALGLTKE